MLRSTIRRLPNLRPILFILTFFVFIVFPFLRVGPLAMLVPPDAVFDKDMRKAMEKEPGLNRSIMVQYLDWLWHALRGDFGSSVSQPPPQKDEYTGDHYRAAANFLRAGLLRTVAKQLEAVNSKISHMAIGNRLYVERCQERRKGGRAKRSRKIPEIPLLSLVILCY